MSIYPSVPPAYSPEWTAFSQRGNRQNSGSSNAANRMPVLTDDCTICFDSLKDKPAGDRHTTTMLSGTECNHFFHEFCLTKWLNASANQDCPNCRAKIRRNNLTTIPVEMKPVVPVRPVAQQPAVPADSIANRVASTAYRIWTAIITESPETTKRRQIEVEHRIVELQVRWNKMPIMFNKSKEDIQVGLASVRSLLTTNTKEALNAVKKLEQVTKKFEDNLAVAQAALMKDMIKFAKELEAVVK
jgi:hypothetical protein